MKRQLLLLVGINLLSLGLIDIASAQTFVPLAPAPAGTKLANLYSSQDLPTFINNLFTASIAIGAILAVLRLAYAGYRYMTSDAFGTKSDAKQVIGDVIIGLLLLLSIWLILRQINPDLLKLDVLRNVKPAATTLPAANPGTDL